MFTPQISSYSFYEHPKLGEDLINTYTSSSHMLVSFSVGKSGTLQKGIYITVSVSFSFMYFQFEFHVTRTDHYNCKNVKDVHWCFSLSLNVMTSRGGRMTAPLSWGGYSLP